MIMLLMLLFLSIALTVTCTIAEWRLRSPSAPNPIPSVANPTPVVVEMREDNDFDDDPPTVVGSPRAVPNIVQMHRIELGWWNMISPALRPGFIKASQFFSWLASL